MTNRTDPLRKHRVWRDSWHYNRYRDSRPARQTIRRRRLARLKRKEQR